MTTSQSEVVSNRATTALERFNDDQNKKTAAMTCPVCGGGFFYKVLVEQFSTGGYGSAQFRSLNQSTETAVVCLCGQLMEVNDSLPKRGADNKRQQFVRAVQKAIELQDKGAIGTMSSQFVNAQEFEKLKESVEFLSGQVEAMLDVAAAKEAADEEEPAEPVTAVIGQVAGQAIELVIHPAVEPEVQAEEIDEVEQAEQAEQIVLPASKRGPRPSPKPRANWRTEANAGGQNDGA